MATPDEHPDRELPAFSRRLHGWFMWYVRRYFGRHFHALRLLDGDDGGVTHPDIAGEPVIFYTNHPAWWDPLIFLLVADALYPDLTEDLAAAGIATLRVDFRGRIAPGVVAEGVHDVEVGLAFLAAQGSHESVSSGTRSAGPS